MNNFDLEDIATSAIQEHIDREMQDTFLHILEGWIFDRENLDFDEMINQAIKNKIDRKFKRLDLNKMILSRLNETISEIIKNVAFEVIKDQLKDGCTFNISQVRKEESK